MSRCEVQIAADRSVFIRKLGSYWEEHVKRKAEGGQRVVVGLSGGSLPALLTAANHNYFSRDWTNIYFVYCDERLVNFNDADSTHKAYRQQFVQSLAVPESHFIKIDPSLTAEACAKDYEKKLKELDLPLIDSKFPVIDVLFLGLGPDGHTCSLFPGHPLLKVADVAIAPITDSPKPPLERVTMTLPVVNAARNVCFAVTGEAKADVIKRILQGNEADPLPGALVKPTTGKLTWILDYDAASKLTKPEEGKL